MVLNGCMQLMVRPLQLQQHQALVRQLVLRQVLLQLLQVQHLRHHPVHQVRQRQQRSCNMKAIKNIDKHDIVIPYEGFTYTFPVQEIVTVDEKVHEYVANGWPLSFSISPKVDKMTPVKEVSKVKTKSMFAANRKTDDLGTEDMQIQSPMGEVPTFGGVDQTPADGKTDADGISWYGPGIEVEEKGE